MIKNFDLSKEEIALFKKLSTPAKIQDYLESLRMNFRDTYMSPRRVIREKKAQCMEGALLAAATLWVHGERPLVMDLRSTPRDEDHVVALFKRRGRWGALSKTNHGVLRYREPVYKTPRELALSYFHEYFLHDGTKTLREFSKPFDLSTLGPGWITSPKSLGHICILLDKSPHEKILKDLPPSHLRLADPIEIKVGRITHWKK